jgi:hypothetical protein
MDARNVKKLSNLRRAAMIEKNTLDGYEKIDIEMHRGENRRELLKKVFKQMSPGEQKVYLKTHIHPEKLEDTDLYY